MCCLRKILGHHLTDLGVVASRLRGFVHNLFIPASADILMKASLSRTLSGQKSSSQETEQNPRPHQGAIQFPDDSLHSKIRTAGRQQVLTTRADVHTESGVELVSRCVLEGGMHMHMFLACSQTNPTKPQEPRQRDER